ncbi:putative membrane protein [Pullulanibacillus pueri]|uniref:Uncharacterized protein n=1 Tax=Pullulanibacillus pueri TaxID=1437324 RepID=A0A8J2ZX39_9BACL|nr:hypothetical protein [Pullulanibacillus pueri]MBM7682768.1 putative membrane protein [Pullulanibacillus pueri]GGH83114.1 hypothetical protein GCM10007096_23500 [Pullulanibacillus pueri]
MGPLIISLVFWLIGIIVIVSHSILITLLKHKQKEFDERAEQKMFNDNSASIANSMGEQVLDLIPWGYIRLVTVIIGMIIIALGFVPLGFLDV